MNKSLLVHLKNKYPHCYVGATGSCIEVISDDNEVLVSLAKNAHGEYADRQHDVGARDSFCLAPIPKCSRVYKLGKDGKVGKDEKHEERKPYARILAKEFGMVPSLERLREVEKKEGGKIVDGDDLHENLKASMIERDEKESEED